MKFLCIRADADSQIGTGHVMRCLALAQAWCASGGGVQFVTKSTASSILSRLREDGITVHFLKSARGSSFDASETTVVARRVDAEWLVLDGYDFNSEYIESIQSVGIKVLAIDDLGRGNLGAADIILNQNIYASASLYPEKLGLLLGLKFALLRREFTSVDRIPKRCVDFVSRVLVTLGGSDFHNITRSVLHLLSAYNQTRIEITVIVGPENRHLDSIISTEVSGHDISVLVNPPDLAEIMATADLVVSAAGSSCWEFAFLGVPMLLVVTAENQRYVASGLEEKGIAHVLGDYTDFLGLTVSGNSGRFWQINTSGF
jgi:UDP-2,4-diacetamido-2,4,6-trideoxy-beta-L-altropyranose hydrolase